MSTCSDPAVRLDWPALPAADGRVQVLLLLDPLDRWSAELERGLLADQELRELLITGCACARVDVDRARGLAATAQTVLAATSGEQGWPALLVRLPDGRPVGAVAYRQVRGRGSLAAVVVQVLKRWQEAPGDLADDAARLEQFLHALAAPPPCPLPPRELLAGRLEAEALSIADPLEGGFGPPPRRLLPALLDFCVTRLAQPDPPPALRRQVERSLDALCIGGVHDHLGGGFFRAATDAAWSLPCFELRLAGNAALVPVLLHAARQLDRSLYRDAALLALDALCAGLRRADGWYAAGRHAESPGDDGRPVAGAHYVWTEAAAAAVIGSQGARRFAQRYLADERAAIGDWRLPVPRGPQEAASDAGDPMPVLLRRLLVARAERPPPPRSTAAWLADQGLVLTALAAAAGHEPDRWQEAGTTLARNLHAVARLGADAPHDLAEPGGPRADARDLAALLGGLSAWHAADGGAPAPQTLVGALCSCRDARGRLLEITDDEEASAAALAVDALRLAGQREQARDLLAACAPELAAAPLACAGLAAAWQRLG